MLDNFYNLYELKQKEYEQKRYTTKKKSIRFSLHMPSIIVEARKLFTIHHKSSQPVCCQAG